MTNHVPEVIHFDEDHVLTPGEVCIACSDPEAGRWVPASFCVKASAVMEAVDQERISGRD